MSTTQAAAGQGGVMLAICWYCLDVHPVSSRRWWKDKHGNLTLLKGCPKCEHTTIMQLIEATQERQP